MFQISTALTFFEDTKTYESKASTLKLFEIDNRKQISLIGKAILDISQYISVFDQQVTPAKISVPLTLPIVLDDQNAPTAYLSLTLTFEPQTSIIKLDPAQVRDLE